MDKDNIVFKEVTPEREDADYQIKTLNSLYEITMERGSYSDKEQWNFFISAFDEKSAWVFFCRYYDYNFGDDRKLQYCLEWKEGRERFIPGKFKALKTTWRCIPEDAEDPINWDTDYGEACDVTIRNVDCIYFKK